MESTAFDFFEELSPQESDLRINSHRGEADPREALDMAFREPAKERHSTAMLAPKPRAHAREFGDNFFFIKKGGNKPQPA